MTVVKRVLTCTLNDMQNRVTKKIGRSISYGLIVNHQPFFIIYASEGENILCMCIVFWNIFEVFKSLMGYFKSINIEHYTSVSF